MPEESLRPATWDDVIRHEAKQARVPAELALAISQAESNGDPAAKSPKGAIGLFQLMPETATELGIDANDPIQNIRGGLKYFRQQLDTHGGNVEQALQAYNWGPTNVAKGGTPPAETQAYVTRILGRLKPAAPAPVAAPRTLTLKDQVQNIGAPPPGARMGAPMEKPPGIVSSLLDSVNPRTRTGRRNIAGGVGDMAGTAVGAAVGTALAPFTGGTSLAAAPVVGGAIGAGTAGALEEYGEELVGTAPSSVMTSHGLTGNRIQDAAIEQGGYAVGGRLLAWPIRAAGKRLVATRVGKFAAQHFEDVLSSARDALGTARTTAADALTAARETTRGLTEQVRQAAGAHVAKAKAFGHESVHEATTAAKASADAVTARYDKIATTPPPVSATTAGRRSQEVINGPARQAREEVGEMVEEAAAHGPDIDIRTLKGEARRIFAEEIRPQTEAFPRPTARHGESAVDDTVEQLQQLSTNYTPDKMATLSPSQRAEAQAIHAALAKAQEDQAQTVLKHPAMNVLGRILGAEDTVPFAAAHQFKRELDEAIGTAWDRSVRSRVTNITKVMRGSLREALAVHEPYNVATKAYQEIAPLYTKGLAPKLRKLVVESPEAIVRMIKPKDPTQLRMLRDILITQPGKVGKQQEGQFAWDSVRSAWTHDHIIQGPLEHLEDRIGKLDPEFLETMYGDAVGQSVLTNLRSISTAFRQAVDAGGASITGAKQRASAGVAEARELGQAAVSAVKTTGRQAERTEQQAGRQLVGTKIADLARTRSEARTFTRTGLAAKGEVLSDVLRATVLGPGSIWGALSVVRLLRGPKSKDLIQYAAYSPEGTQLLVKALTSPYGGYAMADLLRMTGLGDMVVEGVGTPPPKRGGAESGGPNASGTSIGAPPP